MMALFGLKRTAGSVIVIAVFASPDESMCSAAGRAVNVSELLFGIYPPLGCVS